MLEAPTPSNEPQRLLALLNIESMTDYQTLHKMLQDSSIDFKDQEAGIPRRHFLTTDGITFRFQPDGSLAEIYRNCECEPS